jgi:predicted HTH transcriptional regulator
MAFNWNELHLLKENNRIEAKRATGGLPRSIWETYSAFANSSGGYILLGVEEKEDRTLQAVTLPDPERLVAELWNTIHNRQKVNINILSNKHVNITEVDGKRIVIIEIPRADRRDRPVYIGADPFAGSYRRNGEGDYHCSKEEVRHMMRDQSDIPQDARILEYLSLDAFDYESVKRYRTRLQNLRPDHVWENLEHTPFLQKLGCIGRAEDGTMHPSAAGLLMFGYEHEIVKEFPGYFLDYQEHDSNETRWTDRITSNLGDWSGNIFDFYFRISNRITQEAKTPFKLEGATRIDSTPVHTALREALANALTHADYYGTRGLVIHRWPRCISIANPGGLRVSIGDAVSGLSDPRNYTLVKLFNLIGIGERAGSGIPNIFAVWKNEGWRKPVIEEQFNPGRTVLSLYLSQ